MQTYTGSQCQTDASAQMVSLEDVRDNNTYGMLLDRMGLSAKNNWYDDYGRVYIYYTVDEICEDMCCGRDKATI